MEDPTLIGRGSSEGGGNLHRAVSLSLNDAPRVPRINRNVSEPTDHPGGEIANIAIRHQLRLIRTASASRLKCQSPAPPPLLTVASSSSLKSLLVNRASSSGLVGSDGDDTGGGIDDLIDDTLSDSTSSDNEWTGEDEEAGGGLSLTSFSNAIAEGRGGGIAIPTAATTSHNDLTPKMGSTARTFAMTPSTLSTKNLGLHPSLPHTPQTPTSEKRCRKMLHIAIGGDGEEEEGEGEGQEEVYGSQPMNQSVGSSSRGGSTPTYSPNKARSPGDFVFQPSCALKASRAIREEQGKEEDEGEKEGRVMYSCAEGNFDLGGFTIGRGGLVSSPRNRKRARPSLNDGDNFIVLARLGSGNSSAVHKALHLPSMRLVALKALPLYDAERRAQVMRELRILYSNLASITDLNTPVHHHQHLLEQQQKELQQQQVADQGPPAAATGTPRSGDQGGVMISKEGSPGLTAQMIRLGVDGGNSSSSGTMMSSKKVSPSNMAGSSSTTSSKGSSSTELQAVGEADQVVMAADGEEAEREEEWGRCSYIVSFYDAFADPKHGSLTLVVEYMNGGSLQDLVNRGGCANEDVLAHICYNVLMGLSYLHDRKKIHRDIKPSNLLINSMGFVKIADFGVSRSLDYGSDLADTFIGTLGYMSPERITGQGYSYEADMWGFGLSIVTVALGQFPLNPTMGGGGYWGLVHAVCDNSAPELPEETFSEAFRSFVRRCLTKNPQQRASAHDLLLHPFITSRPELRIDASGRISEFPDNREMKVGELEMICHAIAMHLANRKGREGEIVVIEGDETILPKASSAEGGDQQQPPNTAPDLTSHSSLGAASSRSGGSGASEYIIPPLPPPRRLDRKVMIERLALELDLEEGVVAEKLQAELDAIPTLILLLEQQRKQQEEELGDEEKGGHDELHLAGGGGLFADSPILYPPRLILETGHSSRLSFLQEEDEDEEEEGEEDDEGMTMF